MFTPSMDTVRHWRARLHRPRRPAVVSLAQAFPRGLKAILFDFDGTLVDFVYNDTTSLEAVYQATHHPVDCTTFMDTAVEEITRFHTQVQASAADPLAMHPIRLPNTCARLGILREDDFLDRYTSSLLKSCHPFAGAIDLLAGLQQQLRTAVVTNAYNAGEQRARIRHSGLAPYFDTVVVGGEIGSYKPEPAIFHHALEQLHIPADQALMVGDSPQYDIQGAKAAGIKTVLCRQQPGGQTGGADWVVDQGIAGLRHFFAPFLEVTHD